MTVRQTEQELATANERLRLAFEAGSIGGWDFNVKTRENLWFGEAHAHLGLAPDETLGSLQEFWVRVHEEDRGRLQNAIRVAMDKHQSFSEEFRVVWRDGTIHWLRARGHYYYDANGQPDRMLGISVDITQSKRAEQMLRESEERLRLAVRAARMFAYSWDAVTDVIERSGESVEILGIKNDEAATGAAASAMVHPDDKQSLETALAKLSVEAPTFQIMYRIIRPDGAVIWVDRNSQAYFDGQGKVKRIVGMVVDVTERKRAEKLQRATHRILEEQTAALRSQEELLKVFVKNVPTAVAMLDRDLRYLQVSDRWCSDYLPGRAQILGCPHYEIFPDMPDHWKEIHHRALQGETLRAEEDHWDGQDGPHWARWEVRPWKTAQGAVGGILILAEDITHRKKMELSISNLSQRLIQAQEEERATIARELHDDITQRIALACVSLDFNNSGTTVEELRNGIEDVRLQLLQVTRDVQTLSHRLHNSKLEQLGLKVSAENFCKEFSGKHKVQVEFRGENVPDGMPIELELCLFRVLQEALQNAVKHSGARYIQVLLNADSAGIELAVRDFGRGFDPTEALNAEGIGLASMRERLKLVNGQLSIETAPEKGTAIIVRVPLSLKTRSTSVGQ